MKYIKVAVNWLFLLGGILAMLPIRFIFMPLIAALYEFIEEIKESFAYFYHDLWNSDFIEDHRVWLIDGLRWPWEDKNK